MTLLLRCLENGEHYCGAIHTRVADPDVFATLLHDGLNHPEVRAALSTPWRQGYLPCPVDIPIATLLGPSGHEVAEGWILDDLDLRAAQRRRDTWLARRDQGLTPDTPQPPATRPVGSFEGGTVVFRFGAAHGYPAYELINMYPMPPLPDPAHLLSGPCSLVRPFWRTRTDVPFAVLLRTADTYCHPESNQGGLEVLARRCQRGSLDSETAQLMNELDDVVNGHARGLHPHALYGAAEYGEGTDAAFAHALLRFIERHRTT